MVYTPLAHCRRSVMVVLALGLGVAIAIFLRPWIRDPSDRRTTALAEATRT
jgi:hypothetical protein